MTTHRSENALRKSIGTFLYEFLVAFHGDNPFEIRYVPEGKGRGKSISVMRSEGSFCTISPQGQRELKQFSSEGIEDLIISQLFVAADDSAPCFTVNSPNLNNMNSTFTTDNDIIYGGEINSQFVDVDAPEEVRHDAGQERGRAVPRRLLARWHRGAKIGSVGQIQSNQEKATANTKRGRSYT